MAWLKIESSVARNRKFLKAGPAASWLWICGIAYCQEGLTDGFIPREALPALGVLKDADRLATKLVIAGLWDACEDGGWRIHDYLDHNRSASEVSAIRAARAAGGKHGGRPTKKPSAKPSTNSEGLTDETLCETLPVAVDEMSRVDDSVLEKLGAPFHGDTALRQLQKVYPSNRVTYGYRTESAFVDAVQGSWGTFGRMLDNLENHKRSHEWRIKGMVPSLEKWLRDGLWKRTLEEAPPAAERMSRSTSITANAIAEIMAEEDK